MLFIELALIRWLGANVLYLAYFSNVVLLGSFLGIGLGFLWTSRGRRSLFPFVPVALATLIVLVRLLEVKVGIAGGSLIFFGLDTSGPPRWVILPVVFVAVAAVMTCVGDGVARALPAARQPRRLPARPRRQPARHRRLRPAGVLARRPDRVGRDRRRRPRRRHPPAALAQIALTVLPLLIALGFLFAESSEADTRWTPYYKVHTVPIAGQEGVVAEVNGIPTWLQISAVGNPIYETVYERIARQDPGDVLIIGAGSGNDVAVANARGASRVDAVEIDGDLLDLGREPPRPALRRPARRHPRRRRPRLPRADRPRVGHDPARSARLAHAPAGPVVGPPGELPVHRGGRGGVPRPPRPRWHVRHVQLLPRAVARRSLRRHARGRVRQPAVCQHAHRHAVGARRQHRPGRRRRAPTASCSPARAGTPDPATDDHPVPVPARPRASPAST